MQIRLDEHFTYKKLLNFVMPSILMFVVLSVYSVIDGIFVANFVGKTQFAAINLIFPFLMGLGSLGLMIGAGGSAIVAKNLGEKKQKRANGIFSMLVYITILLGVLLTLLGYLAIKPLVFSFNASDELKEYALLYGNIVLLSLTPFLVQNAFETFFITAQKPKLGFYSICLAGVIHIVLDYILIVLLKQGLIGAAFSTLASMLIGGILPLVYFFRKNSSLLRLSRPLFHFKSLVQTCFNGSSELVTQLSGSIVAVLYNYQLLKYAGENGVVAFGIINYICFVFFAICLGYSTGCAPLFSYHYGAKNSFELNNLFIKSLKILGILGIFLFIISQAFAYHLVGIFTDKNTALFEFSLQGYQIFVFAFLICGFNVFSSAFFTALNNGLISALISFLRTIVFEMGAILILPLFLGVIGIWLAISISEILTLIVTIICFIVLRKRYGYL